MAGWLLQRAAELRRDFTWREAGGSLGDLGTFVPLLVGLTVTCGLDVGTTLVFTGLYNLATALVVDVPMPPQPMSACHGPCRGHHDHHAHRGHRGHPCDRHGHHYHGRGGSPTHPRPCCR